MSSHRTQRGLEPARGARRRLCSRPERSGLGRTAVPASVRLAGSEEARTARSRWGCRATRSAASPSDGRPDLAKALAATKELGLHYWEAYPGPRADELGPMQPLEALKTRDRERPA